VVATVVIVVLIVVIVVVDVVVVVVGLPGAVHATTRPAKATLRAQHDPVRWRVDARAEPGLISWPAFGTLAVIVVLSHVAGLGGPGGLGDELH
jgi:hypothetical protein